VIAFRGNSGENVGQVCDSACQKGIAAKVAKIIPKTGGQGCGSACQENIVNQVTAALTPIIKMNACGETCQKGIACNVLNYDGFSMMLDKDKYTQTLGDAVSATATAADETWIFQRDYTCNK
jgi:hypothetical protein